eukprot:3332641-Pyramimonas_sp.AAC.1
MALQSDSQIPPDLGRERSNCGAIDRLQLQQKVAEVHAALAWESLFDSGGPDPQYDYRALAVYSSVVRHAHDPAQVQDAIGGNLDDDGRSVNDVLRAGPLALPGWLYLNLNPERLRHAVQKLGKQSAQEVTGCISIGGTVEAASPRARTATPTAQEKQERERAER